MVDQSNRSKDLAVRVAKLHEKMKGKRDELARVRAERKQELIAKGTQNMEPAKQVLNLRKTPQTASTHRAEPAAQ